MSIAPASDVASGFSQNTGLPAAGTSCTSRGCSAVHVVTYTTSAASITASSLARIGVDVAAWNDDALASSGSNTPTSTASSTWASIDAWYCAMNPPPRNPTLIDMAT